MVSWQDIWVLGVASGLGGLAIYFLVRLARRLRTYDPRQPVAMSGKELFWMFAGSLASMAFGATFMVLTLEAPMAISQAPKSRGAHHWSLAATGAGFTLFGFVTLLGACLMLHSSLHQRRLRRLGIEPDVPPRRPTARSRKPRRQTRATQHTPPHTTNGGADKPGTG